MSNNIKKHSQNLFLIALLVSPVIFFTDLTRNPYLIQERILQVLIAVSMLFAAFSVFKNKTIVLPRTFLDAALAVFFSVALFSIIISLFRYFDFRWSILSYSGRRMLMFLFSGLIPYYFVAGYAKDEDFLDKVKKVVITAGSVASAYALLQFLKLDFIWPRAVEPYGQRSISTFGNPNFLSSFLLIVIFWVVGYVLTAKRPKFWFAVLIMNLIGLAITMTRSTYLGLMVGLVIVVYILYREYKDKLRNLRITIGLIVSILIVSTAAFYSSSAQFRKRLISFFSIEKMGAAFTQRILIWEASYNMFSDTPVIGRGWGNFEIFYPFYQGKIVEKEAYSDLRTHANNAHNIFMELLPQVGIVGAGIYIWLIIIFIVYAGKIYKKAEGVQKVWVIIFSVGGISFWIDNILNVSMFFPMPAYTFWLNAGLLSVVGRKVYGYPKTEIKAGKWYKLIFLAFIIGAAGVTCFNYKYLVSSIHFFKGFKYSRQGQLELARKELEHCHSIYSLNVDNNYELGNIYARLSEKNRELLDKSIMMYKEALKANPGYDEIYFNMGMVYLKIGEQKKGIASLEKALEINPLLPEGWRTLGDVEGKKKNFKKAIECYKKAVKLNPQDGHLWNNYGNYLEGAGKTKEALESYVKAIKFKTNMKLTRMNIRRAARKYSETAPLKEINSLFARTVDLIEEKNWDEVLKIIKQILELDPVNLRAMLYAGNVCYKTGKVDEAVEYYKIILAIDPENKTANMNMQAITKAQE
ncbi:tetratricopeptide repeat protein [Elusimicrobiota bacterium]